MIQDPLLRWKGAGRSIWRCLRSSVKNFKFGLSFEKTVRNVKHIETNPNKILSNINSSASCKFTEKYSEQSPDRAEQRSMQKDGEESKEERHKSERERESGKRERERRKREKERREKKRERKRKSDEF